MKVKLLYEQNDSESLCDLFRGDDDEFYKITRKVSEDLAIVILNKLKDFGDNNIKKIVHKIKQKNVENYGDNFLNKFSDISWLYLTRELGRKYKKEIFKNLLFDFNMLQIQAGIGTQLRTGGSRIQDRSGDILLIKILLPEDFSKDNWEELWKRLNRSLLHELTHFCKTDMQQGETFNIPDQINRGIDPEKAVLNYMHSSKELEARVSELRREVEFNQGNQIENYKIIYHEINEFIHDYFIPLYHKYLNKDPSMEEIEKMIQVFISTFKQRYTEFSQRLNLKEENKMNMEAFKSIIKEEILELLKEGRSKCAAGLIAINERNGKVLVGRRSQHVNNPGAWVFPGGKVEGRESFRGAALREFGEETWYRGGHNNLQRVYMQPSDNFNYYMYMGTVENFDFKMDDREFDIMEWVDYNDFRENPKYETKHPRLKEALSDEKINKKIQKYIEEMI